MKLYPGNRTRSPDMWDGIYDDVNWAEYCDTIQYDDSAAWLQGQLVDTAKGAHVFDIGCGPGRHLKMLTDMGFQRLSALEPSATGRSLVAAHLPGVQLYGNFAPPLPLDNASVDVAIMVGIVYEIEDPEKHRELFREIARVLTPGGRLLFVCNIPLNWGAKRYIRAMDRKDQTTKAFFLWQFDNTDVRRLANQAGMRVASISRMNFGKNLYRFDFGRFVDKKKRDARAAAQHSINTYSLHDQYLANRDPSLFNLPGRLLWHLQAPLKLNRIFYNSECYAIERPL